MDRHASCHGWQLSDLAVENINSAISLLGVAVEAASNESTGTQDLEYSLRLIKNLLKGSLPALSDDFPAQPNSLVLVPSKALSSVT